MPQALPLLSDQQIQRFITEGYHLVHTDFTEPVHQNIHRQLEEVFAQEGNVGNNILPRIPQIRQVFDHPAMRGALTSLLGPDYILNPHRHCHLNAPGSGGQSWHKDCYVFDHNFRHPRFHWLLALYYPQDVSEDMGPTGILPGVQYSETISDPNPTRCAEKAQPLIGKAGTIALVHFDAWHRATANTSQNKRYMLKFQFARLREPTAPTWQNTQAEWQLPTSELAAAHQDVWHWLRGQPQPPVSAEPATTDLFQGSEAQRRQRAYGLAGGDNPAFAPLVEALRQEALAREETIEAKTPDNAHGTNPTAFPATDALIATGPKALPHIEPILEDPHWLVRAAATDILATIGPPAQKTIPALRQSLGDDHWWVRRGAAEALGRMGPLADSANGALSGTLSDADRRVRRMSALALAQIGRPAPDALAPLQAMLQDEDRYNRFYAALALRRLPEPQAQEILLDSLTTARWCPLTTSQTPY